MKHAIHSALEQHSLQKLRANLKLSILIKNKSRCEVHSHHFSTSNTCVTVNKLISIICWGYLDAEVMATVKSSHRNLRLGR